MNTEDLMNEFGLIDDKIIESANPEKAVKKSIKITARRFIYAAAACLVLTAVTISAKTFVFDTFALHEISFLESESDEEEDGMFESYWVYDAQELANGNPWSDNKLIWTMPVFKNPTGGYNINLGLPNNLLSEDDMTKKAKEYADMLDAEVRSIEVSPTQQDKAGIIDKLKDVNGLDSAPAAFITTHVKADCGDIIIDVDYYDTVEITINDINLPSKYKLSYYDTSRAQAEETVRYLNEKYAKKLGFKNPEPDITGHYNVDDRYCVSYSAYEKSGFKKEQILGYNFNRISYGAENENTLSIIIRKTDLSQKLGDYPIISAKKARELLLNQEYMSSSPYKIKDEKYIASVELMYYNTLYENYLVPFYQFYVEIPQKEQEGGMKTFGSYLVPAVKSKYLKNMPMSEFMFQQGM